MYSRVRTMLVKTVNTLSFSLSSFRLYFMALLCVSLPLLSAYLSAHPEDELCGAGDMDPVLCAELSRLDRPAAVDTSSALPSVALERSPVATLLLYTRWGIKHILPMGLDHLAFVLALLLSSKTFRPLILQISLFTVAHSVTLVMGMLGILRVQGHWVEIAIAGSIVFVAIENIFLRTSPVGRMAIVFCFGLLHGLGFVGALSDLGMPKAHFFSALLGFNLGVELGQLTFAALIFLLLYKFFKKAWYRPLVVLPASMTLALVGAFWIVDRWSAL